MSPRKNKTARTTKRKTRKGYDAEREIIRYCVEYVTAAAGADAAFRADVGDYELAEPVASKLSAAARSVLPRITGIYASTSGGIASKANVAALLLRTKEGTLAFDPAELSFLYSFAVQVDNFARRSAAAKS